jgi:choline dehydrogenase-like flavoprotein
VVSVIDKSFDVVIVGSGAGGGAVAKELAPLCREGRSVAVLEWGPELGPEEFTGREVEMASKLYFDSGGMLTKDGTMTLAMGKGLGGSTVVYTGTSLTIPEEVVERWSVPGLDAADLLTRSQKYISENNVHLQPESLLNDNNRLFRKGCQELGFRVEQFPVNLKGCRAASLCNLGCPNGAKQGTHVVQLPKAREQGVEMITNCKVHRIGEREVIASVDESAFGKPCLWAAGNYRISAKVVIVCGGAVQSPALLLRSGLGRELPMIGRYLTTHPALILVGEHPEPISNFHGHPKSFYCDEFWHSDGFLLESCMYFPFTTSKNLIGFGPEHEELMRRFAHLQMILVLAVDDATADNRVVLDSKNEALVDYTLSEKTLNSLHRSMIAAAKIFFAAGARRVHAPAGETFLIDAHEADDLERLIPRSRVLPGRISVASAHLMGGCRMGADRSDSVTDAWGAVHGKPWLFVADSSLFPRASEINPYVTVMGLADRVAEAVRHRAGDLLA